MKLWKRFTSALLTLLVLFQFGNLGNGIVYAETDDLEEPTEEVEIHVKWLGEGQDASPAIKEAIEEAKTVNKPVKLIFEKDRQYEIYPETAYHETGYYVSNAATKGENPNGERWSAIFLKDMKNVTIEGNNALLNIHGVMTPLLIDNSENIVFQNLNVDWARPTMSEFTVTEVGSNYAKISINKDSLYEIEGNQVRWLSEKKSDGTYYWTLKGGLCGEYDPVQDKLWRSGFSWGNTIQFEGKDEKGNDILRLAYNSRPNLTVGRTFQFRSGSRDQVGSFIYRSENVKFENMGFHYMHGLGIVAQYTKDISFNNMDCTPRPETGRVAASSADFMQISGCYGLVSITNSKFRGAHDDAFNIHGTHLQVVSKDETQRKVTVRFKEERSWGSQAFEPGHEIEFINSDTMLPYASNEVVSFNRLNDYDIELTLKEPLPEGIRLGADVVENVTYTPDVLVKGNEVYGVPTRGILCTTRGNVVIEDNLFYKTAMSGVLLEDDARGWYESGYIRDMTIQNNQFIECGGPAIFSNPQTRVYDPNKTVHSGIKILDNYFKGNSHIKMMSTSDVVIAGNEFEGNNGNVELVACNGFEVADNNVGLKNVSASNSLNDRSLGELKIDSSMKVENIDRTGMTATAVNSRTGYEPIKMLDNNNSTMWHTDWENPPKEISFTVNLNGPKTFNRFVYTPRQNGETTAMITGYDLYARNGEGEEFKKIAEGTWLATAADKYADFEAVTATEVKLVVTDCVKDSSGRNVASAAEVNFQLAENLVSEMPIGKRFKLDIQVLGRTGSPAVVTPDMFTYSSSNPEVAVIAEDGTITGLKAGKSDITVEVNGYGKTLSAKATVTISDEVYTNAETITIDTITKAEGVNRELTAMVTPVEASGDVSWKVETLSGGRATMNGNILTASESGRYLVTAYSINNPEVKDIVMITVTAKEKGDDSWSIVRENENNWNITENNGLRLQTEYGALWAGTNNAKNIITMPMDKEDYSFVTKMNYKSANNYAEAGIIVYVDDSNYVMLTRKKHSGYGGNIFSMISEVNGSNVESPASVRVPDTFGKDIYLKIDKKGNSYSGYYSVDGESWMPVWENHTAALSGTPRVGVVGYNSGSGSDVAVYDYLQIDDEKITFEGLLPLVVSEESKITEMDLTEITVDYGTTWEEVSLPAVVEVTWNEEYKEVLDVVWDKGNYDDKMEGTYVIKGKLDKVPEEMYNEYFAEIKVKVLPREISQEELSLQDAIDGAKELMDSAVIGIDPGNYLQFTVDKLQGAIEAAQDVLDNKNLTSQDYKKAEEALNAAVKEFKDSAIPEPSQNENVLINSIRKAERILADASIGDDKGQYPEAAATELREATEGAKKLLIDSTADKDKYKTAAKTLDEAIKKFKDSRIK